MVTADQPRVSVLIISFNQKDYIVDAMESAVNQDYDNLEVIVSDDASTDGTSEIIAAYQQRYPERLVALLHKDNVGITGNSNRGLLACSGQFIAFQGGDDVLLPGKIARQIEWFNEDNRRVICYHDMDVFDSATGKTLYLQSERYRFYTGGAETLVRHGTYFGGTTAMVRVPKDVKVFFSPEIPVASDWLYWIEVVESQQGYIGYIDGGYARYRRHTNNVTRTGSHEVRDTLKTLEIVEAKYPKYSAACLERRAMIYFVAAYHALKKYQPIRFMKYLTSSLIACHGNIFKIWPLMNRL